MRSYLFRTLATCALTLTPALSFAQADLSLEPPYSAQYKTCIAKFGDTDPGVRACDEEESERLDYKLNWTYKQLIGTLEPRRKLVLQKAERAWITFRDANCDYDSSVDSTTLDGGFQMNIECKMKETYARIQALTVISSKLEQSSTYTQCFEKVGGTTTALKECENDELARKDSALNVTYKELIALLKPERKSTLQRAQRAWIALRDAECDYEASGESDTLHTSLIIKAFSTDKTILRLKSLQNYLEIEKEYGPD